MSNNDPTVSKLFAQLREWGAASITQVMRDENEVPLRAIIIVEGVPETGEILAVVDPVIESWTMDGNGDIGDEDDPTAGGEGDTPDEG